MNTASLKLTIRCVFCKAVTVVEAVDPRDVPLCPRCYSPTTVEKVER